MRIAVLAYALRVAGGLSVGRNVVSALGRVADEHEYLLLMPAGVGYEEIPKPSHCVCHYYRRRAGSPGQVVYEQFRVPRLVRQFRPDVIWGLGNGGLSRPPAPQAILWHLPHLLYDRRQNGRTVWSPTPYLYYVRWRTARCLPATALVFCQTQTAARRFRERFSFDGPIVRMPNAVSRFALPRRTPARPAPLRTLQGRFVLLCLTRYYPHKNLEALLEVFGRHRAELADVAVILTVTPGDGAGARRLLRRVERLRLQRHLVNVGRIDQSELAAYYTHTAGLILPTLLESFSGTYLEAMQFQRPILTSDLDFAREICGSAAVYFDPWDPRAIRDAILRVRDDAALRATLVEAARQRLEGAFRSWDQIVRDAVDSLERLAAQPAACAASDVGQRPSQADEVRSDQRHARRRDD